MPRRFTYKWRIICGNCGEEDIIPFKPNPHQKYYCRNCYKKIILKKL